MKTTHIAGRSTQQEGIDTRGRILFGCMTLRAILCEWITKKKWNFHRGRSGGALDYFHSNSLCTISFSSLSLSKRLPLMPTSLHILEPHGRAQWIYSSLQVVNAIRWSFITYLCIDYQDFQTSTTTPYQYYIFTQDQAVSDAQLLVDTYNQLPSTALNKVCIYGSENCNVAITKLIVITEDGKDTYHITNSTSGWPLAADSPIVQDADELKHFMNKLIK